MSKPTTGPGARPAERPPGIVVIGATGYTGGLVARALADGRDTVVLAGRDAERLADVAAATGDPLTQLVDVTDPGSLRALIRAGDAVINTAGPFAELGEPVVRACVESGAHYVDTTGEQPFMKAMYERYHQAAADAGVSVVNAMAFEYALGDPAVAITVDGATQPIRSLDVVYAWGGTASSRGTRQTVLRMLGTRAWIRRDGAYRKQTLGSRGRTVTLRSGRALNAVAFGAGEVVTAPRYVEVENAQGWVVMGGLASRLLLLVAPALPVLVPVLRPLLAPLVTRKPDPTPAERDASAFTIRVEVEDADGACTALEIHGTDPYGLTADAAVYGARRVTDPDAPRGVLAPSQLVEPRAFLTELGVELVADD